MVNSGWVKLYRELLAKSIWQLSSSEQKAVLITILLLANHEENEWEWNGEKYSCKPGQLITSLKSLAESSGRDISIKNVRTALTRFEKLGFLTNASAKTGRLITVVNWAKYQDQSYAGGNADGIATGKEVANRWQRGGKQVATNKNNKNDKNDKNNPLNPPVELDEDDPDFEGYTGEELLRRWEERNGALQLQPEGCV